MDAVSAAIFGSGQAICQKQSSSTIKLITRFCIKPCNSTLDQPLQKRLSALDWLDQWNQHRQRGKQLAMVMMFVG